MRLCLGALADTRLFHARLRALEGTGRLAEHRGRVPAEALQAQRRPVKLRPGRLWAPSQQQTNAEGGRGRSGRL